MMQTQTAMDTMAHPAGDWRRRQIAAWCWLGCLQYFVLEAISTAGYIGPYSYRTNYMSDLGAVQCLAVCSRWHALINTSFVVQGVLISAGALLLPRRKTPGVAGLAARFFLLVSAVGVVLVGLTPEDVNNRIHIRGALLNFVGGSVGLLLLGFSFLLARGLRSRLAALTLSAGALSLAADMLFVFPNAWLNAAMGVGLLERIAGYPLPLLLASIGVVLLSERPSRSRFPA